VVGRCFVGAPSKGRDGLGGLVEGCEI
jgi:hypothetical protein